MGTKPSTIFSVSGTNTEVLKLTLSVNVQLCTCISEIFLSLCAQTKLPARDVTGQFVLMYFFLNFLLDQGPLCGATNCPYVAKGFKVRVLVHSYLLVYGKPKDHVWYYTCLFHH